MEYSKTYNTTFCFKENVSSLMKHSESKCLLKNFFWYYLYITFFSCTCYRYKTFIQYQKKKQNKTKQLYNECNVSYVKFISLFKSTQRWQRKWTLTEVVCLVWNYNKFYWTNTCFNILSQRTRVLHGLFAIYLDW